MKRLLTLTIVLGLVSLWLAGCGSETTGGDGEQDVTLRLSGWASSEAETKVLLDQIKAFNQKYPHIKVEYEPINGDYMQQIQMMMATQDEPDVFYMDVSFAQDYIEQDVLVDLTPFIEQQGTDVDDFYPSLLEGFMADGKIYGLPKDYSTLALVYNKEVFEQANVTPPTTWDELVEVAKAVTSDEMVGLSLQYELARLGPFIFQNGGQFVQDDGSVQINTPQAVEALQYYYDLKAKHGAADTPSNLGDGWPGDSFKNRRAAMVLEGPWIVGFLQEQAPDLAYEVVELPFKHEKATYAFTVAYVIGKNSRHQDEAFQLLEFLTGPEAQEITAAGGLAIPSRMSVAESFIDQYPEREAWVIGAEYAQPWTLGPQFNRKNEAIGEALEAVFLGLKDVEEALREAQEKIDALQ